jgi:hypothetical protein
MKPNTSSAPVHRSILNRPSFCKGQSCEKHPFVPTAVYGILDYVGDVGLIATPFIFGFVSIGGVAVILPIVLDLSQIIYSLMID